MLLSQVLSWLFQWLVYVTLIFPVCWYDHQGLNIPPPFPLRPGTLQGNHEILRDIKSLVHRLPLMDNPKFQSDYAVQCNDVTLITYLGSITKGCNTVNQFVGKFNTLYDRQGMGRRMRGLFY